MAFLFGMFVGAVGVLTLILIIATAEDENNGE